MGSNDFGTKRKLYKNNTKKINITKKMLTCELQRTWHIQKQNLLTVRHQQDFQPIQNTDPSKQFSLHHEQPGNDNQSIM